MLREADEFLLLSELAQARGRTDQLFELVPKALFYERPIRERHRLAFYLGHLEAFDANLLLRDSQGHSLLPAVKTATGRKPVCRDLHRLFAFGIDPVESALPNDTVEDWPARGDIETFVHDTRRQLNGYLIDATGSSIEGAPLATLLHVAIEHRLMHAETLAYSMNRLSINKPVRLIDTHQREFTDNDRVTIPAGVTQLGVGPDEQSYAWDNEYDTHEVEVPQFAIDRYMVSNAQFLRFIEAGGYSNRSWWTNEAWHWRESQQVLHPASWQWVADQWCQSSLYDLVPFQGDWPVYVSHAEAAAYANWRGQQLPTEAQWQRAAYAGADAADFPYPWGNETPNSQHGHFNFRQWDPMPVDSHPAGRSAFGVMGLLGNGWEWTSTVFAPFAGFKPYAFYPGYSADFFDDRHFVLKGGSAHTATRLLRRSFRNWFQPHYPYVCAGFRCVSN